MIKGEIWWAHLPSPRRSEPAKKRPVLVIQGDDFNFSSLNTVICAVVTSNVSLAKSPPNMLLETAESHLQKTSVVNFSQLVTVDKSFMSQLVTMLPKQFIPRIDSALKTIFNIS